MTIAEILSHVNYANLRVGNRWLKGGTGKKFKVLEERKNRTDGLKIDYRGKIVVHTNNEARAVYELLKGGVPKLYADAIKKAKADLKKKKNPAQKGYKVLCPDGTYISVEEYMKSKDYDRKLEKQINAFMTDERERELIALFTVKKKTR